MAQQRSPQQLELHLGRLEAYVEQRCAALQEAYDALQRLVETEIPIPPVPDDRDDPLPDDYPSKRPVTLFTDYERQMVARWRPAPNDGLKVWEKAFARATQRLIGGVNGRAGVIVYADSDPSDPGPEPPRIAANNDTSYYREQDRLTAEIGVLTAQVREHADNATLQLALLAQQREAYRKREELQQARIEQSHAERQRWFAWVDRQWQSVGRRTHDALHAVIAGVGPSAFVEATLAPA